ncbi:Sulfotransferase 1A2, partial [Gryllus bimaculatus]
MVVVSPTSTLPATRGATAAAGPFSFIRDARRVIRRAERPGRGVASMAVSEAVAVTPLEGERVRKLLGLLKLGNEPQARFGPTGCVLAARFADSLGDVRAFEVRDDDVWVVTPPKCAREPKDTAVSFYHHYKLLSGYTGDKEFFFECFYEGLVEHSPLWEHVLEFWKIKDQPNILFNTYEEMKELTRLVEHLDIKQMKRNPATNYEDLFTKAREEGRISDDQAFIRKGVVGEGRREMSPEMAARFDERTRRVFNEAVGGCPWQI